MLLSAILFVALAGGGYFAVQRGSALETEKAGLAAQLSEVQGQYQTAESQRQALSGFAEIVSLQQEVAALRAEIKTRADDPSLGFIRGRARNLWVNYDTPPEVWTAEQKAQLQAQIAGLRALRDVVNSVAPSPAAIEPAPAPVATAPAEPALAAPPPQN